MNSKATVFQFTSYEFEPALKRAVFHYKTEFLGQDPILFTETILLPKIPELENVPKELLQKLLESLHIILGISYYKFYCPPAVALAKEGAILSKSEADFFNTVYKKGLGEFFYKNNLNPSVSPKFPFEKNKRETSYSLEKPFDTAQGKNEKCLVGIGGGKDSIVSAELLKENGFDINAFLVNSGDTSTISQKIVEILNVPSLGIERVLDPKVHQPHQYNGHIPISAIYAFLGVFSAILYNYSYVIVSNEHSSNFGNLKYKGLEINHQWSKSFEFESLFSQYVKNSLTPDVTYFSLLRPFYEIRIVKIFAKYKPYFAHFSSCNANFKIKGKESRGLWCGVCPKCVFVFMLLSAFLPKKELVEMFGKNLYQSESLLPLFKDVLGFGNMKPFDCVGTFQEAQTALKLAEKKFAGDFIMRQFSKRAKLSQDAFKTNTETLVLEQFKFLGMQNALIVGYGKEGQVTKTYLKKHYPTLKIGIADAKQGSKYLNKQTDFDIAIKTPGIQKSQITIPHTTATNMFFSQIKGKNTIIGVTGSKGKSTTSSLIYHILKTAGKKVQLLGNIGQPMLAELLKPVDKDTIFVLELSSYQLDDIAFSPDIAVVTNLFPEHLDFHGNLKNYYAAKKNIINFQGSKDYFVYNSKTASWLKGYKGKPVEFSKKKYENNLLGEHNQSNIAAAVSVASILEITEADIAKAIKSFVGLPHRLELVGKYHDISFYDDAISTTPESTIMAIKALKNVDTIFLGGTDRGYNFIQLEKTIKKYNIKNVVLFPDSGNRILNPSTGSGQNLRILKTSSMKEAVAFAYQYTQKGKICLLSCASPSYSLWKNFEQKGDEFKKMVKMLSKSVL